MEEAFFRLITSRAIVGGGVNLTNPCQDAAAFGFSPQTTRRYARRSVGDVYGPLFVFTIYDVRR